MASIRQRMVEDMQLRGLSEKTQEAYVHAVQQLAAYYDKSPRDVNDEELRQYFLHLTNDRQLSSSTINVALYGIKFLYQYTLRKEWPTLDLVRPRREKKLPVVLSVAEVHRILNLVRRPRYRLCLSTICLLSAGERRRALGSQGHRQRPDDGTRPTREGSPGSPVDQPPTLPSPPDTTAVIATSA